MSQECKFCEEFEGYLPENSMPAPIGDRIIRRYQNFVLLPTLGALVEGYCLLMPLKHELSFAKCCSSHLDDEIENIVEDARRLVQSRYGQSFVAEHGIGNPSDCGAACCSHSHLHIIPCASPDRVLDAYLNVGGEPKVLSTFQGLQGYDGQSYVYLSRKSGEHFIWPACGFQTQFVRRVAASLTGSENQWDWRDFHHTENMHSTLKELRQTTQCSAKIKLV